MKTQYGNILKALTVFLVVICMLSASQNVYAKESTAILAGTVYEFGKKDHYEFSNSGTSADATNKNTMGSVNITGNIKEDGETEGFKSYIVSSGNISIRYAINPSILNAKETDWHLINDSSKKVDTFSLKKNIQNGAVLVQSSKDGKSWITDVQICDVFKTGAGLSDSIYKSKDVQLENGCFYRVVVVYELQRKIDEKKTAFMKTDINEEKKVAEVYQFYAVNEKNAGGTISAADEPRKEIASKPVKTERDKGFSGVKNIDKDDPHFGWTLGTFVINGYTRTTTYEGNTFYLKNVGDKITLWFTLNQDINKLNGNSNYSIAEDKKAYDQAFGINETNFGQGTLIISYTDYQGKTHDPIVYTNFLAANATTGADTRVRLFEEGDYECVLDYVIKNTPRKVGSVDVIPEYTDYKIPFSFSIRNGNCMVYPFDTKTGNELSDNAITANGFKLDMAKSRYLTIDVTRTVLKNDSDGILTEDIRFNRPAKDNESYEDEGIYTFAVKNLYTGSTTTKTLYVGTNKYYSALSKNNISVTELNAKIAEGWTVEEGGTLSAPVIEPEPETAVEAEPESETVVEPEEEKKDEPGENTETVAETKTVSKAEPVIETNTNEITQKKEAQVQENGEGEKSKTEASDNSTEKNTEKTGSSFPFVIFGLLAAGVGGTVYVVKKKGKRGGAE